MSADSKQSSSSKFRVLTLTALILAVAIISISGVIVYTRWNRPIEWIPYSEATLNQSLKGNQLVLLNFRATWDLLSIQHEEFALETPKVRRWIHSHNVISLQADYTNASPEIKDKLKSLKTLGFPVVAIYSASTPNRPIVLDSRITEELVLDALEKASR